MEDKMVDLIELRHQQKLLSLGFGVQIFSRQTHGSFSKLQLRKPSQPRSMQLERLLKSSYGKGLAYKKSKTQLFQGTLESTTQIYLYSFIYFIY